MTTYYATCDANGAVSVRLDASSPDEARAALEKLRTNEREVIDAPRTDAEGDLGINGEGMAPHDFAEELKSVGATLVEDSDIYGDWELWEAPEVVFLGENLNRAISPRKAMIVEKVVLDGRERANPAALRNVPEGTYRVTRIEGNPPGDVRYWGYLLGASDRA